MVRSIFEKSKKMKVEIKEVTENAVYFEVKSTSGKVYTVSLRIDGKFACDCQHFAVHPGTLCSHVIAAINKLLKNNFS